MSRSISWAADSSALKSVSVLPASLPIVNNYLIDIQNTDRVVGQHRRQVCGDARAIAAGNIDQNDLMWLLFQLGVCGIPRGACSLSLLAAPLASPCSFFTRVTRENFAKVAAQTTGEEI